MLISFFISNLYCAYNVDAKVMQEKFASEWNTKRFMVGE